MQNKIAFGLALAAAALALITASGKAVPSWVSTFVLALAVIVLLASK